MDMTFNHRSHDWESFDKITLEVVPRFKQSGLSGDEWRHSISVKFYFKGQVVHETGFSNMKYAVMLLANEWIRAQEPISNKVIEIEKTACDQVGCPDRARSIFLMKKVTSLQGEYLDPGEYSSFTNYRKFCERHSHRGDGSREDCDENYSIVESIPKVNDG